MRNWEGVEMREGSRTGEGEDELDVQGGFIAVDDGTEREEKRRCGCGGKASGAGGEWGKPVRRDRKDLEVSDDAGLHCGERKTSTRSFNVPGHVGQTVGLNLGLLASTCYARTGALVGEW